VETRGVEPPTILNHKSIPAIHCVPSRNVHQRSTRK